MEWIQIDLPTPGKGTHITGYTIKHEAVKGYSLRMGYDNNIVVVPWKKDYEDMLKELHNLLEMQKSGISFWLNKTTRCISTNKR